MFCRIPEDMRKIGYCEGIRKGNESDWNFLWQQYRKSNEGTEKSIILVALACTRQIWLLRQYLDWSLDKPNIIKIEDAPTVFKLVAEDAVGSYVAKDFFYSNFHKILKQ